MTRRNFLRNSIGGGALLSLATPAVAQSAPTLRLLSSDPLSARALTNRITAATGDTVKIETTNVDPSEAATMLDLVSGGEADMCLAQLDRFLPQNLAFGLFASMPFGMSAGELEGWLHASDGNEVLTMLGDAHGVSIQLAGDTGTKPMWSKEPLSNLADLQTKNVGSSGLGILNLTQIGVRNVVDIHGTSFDLETLDVIDGLSVVEMAAAGLTDVFPHICTSNPNTPSGVVALCVAKGGLDGLSDGQRIVIERACSANLTDGMARSFDANAKALASAGASLSSTPMPADIWQAFADGAQQVLKMIFDEGSTQAAVVDAYVYFLQDIAGWSEIGEAAYYTGRQRLVSL